VPTEQAGRKVVTKVVFEMPLGWTGRYRLKTCSSVSFWRYKVQAQLRVGPVFVWSTISKTDYSEFFLERAQDHWSNTTKNRKAAESPSILEEVDLAA
jgi:hypothetical protein